jgi:hypothetical protein
MEALDRWAKKYEAVAWFAGIWAVTLALLGGLVYPLGVALYYNNAGRQPDADWVRHLFLRKEAALALAGAGPRVLVVGGSGCLFSLDVAVMERELGQPVVNLCSHAGLGLEYFLARARRHARSGDTVVLALEYRVMNFPDGSQSNIEWNYFTSWDRRHYLEHGVRDAYGMLYRIPFSGLWESGAAWKRIREGYRDQLHYDVLAMTAGGNLHQSTGNLKPLFGRIELQFHPPSEYTGQMVGEFAKWAKGRGVRVVGAYQAAAVDAVDDWRTKEYFRLLPEWWRGLGIEPMGTPEQAKWRPAYFMDTMHHGGPGVAYQNGLRVAAAMRGGSTAGGGEVLLLPAHPSRSVLPLPAREGAEVELWAEGDEEAEGRVRAYLQSGRRVRASTSALGNQLRARGFTVKPTVEEYTTAKEVLEANRERIVVACVRRDAPAGFALDGMRAGVAAAGVWREGQWTMEQGEKTAALATRFEAGLATGERMEYRVEIQATESGCGIKTYEVDRYPSGAAVRMMVIDPARGIAKGLYEFGADGRAEVRWLGEVGLR